MIRVEKERHDSKEVESMKAVTDVKVELENAKESLRVSKVPVSAGVGIV